MTDFRDLIRQMAESYESGNLTIQSWNVSVEGQPPHQWHEEWMHLARKALEGTPIAPTDGYTPQVERTDTARNTGYDMHENLKGSGR